MSLPASPPRVVRHPGQSRTAAPKVWPWLVRGFSAYSSRYLRRHFRALRLNRGGRPRWATDQPLVVYLNHAAWWDPLVCLSLVRSFFPGHQIYAPIDADQLGRYRIFNRLGFFGVKPGSLRGAKDFLRISQAILQSPDAMLWLTPQARFVDARARPVTFEQGIGHLTRVIPNAQFVPLAVEYTFWNERLPEILCRFGEPLLAADLQPGQKPPSVLTSQLARHLEATMDHLAEEAKTRDPYRFEVVWHRRCGVNPVYDLWRRLRSLVGGKRFNTDHGDDAS